MTRTFLEGGIRLFPGFLSHILLSKIHFFKCMFSWRPLIQYFLLQWRQISSRNNVSLPNSPSWVERQRGPHPNPPPTLFMRKPQEVARSVPFLPLTHIPTNSCKILDHPRLLFPMKDIQTRSSDSSAPLNLWVLWPLFSLLEMALYRADPQDLFSVRHKPHLKVVFSTLSV